MDSPASLQQYSRPVLVQAVIECCNRLKQVDQERLDLKKVIGDSVSVRKQYIALTRTYKELQEAHLSQSKHIQKMQKQHAKLKTYQNTIVMQEKVISKMQSVIEAHLRAASSHPAPHVAALSTSLPSRPQQDRQQQQPQFTDKDQSPPGQSRSHSSAHSRASSDLQAQVAKLNAEISSKDIRIDALQDQLTISATEASREIASLRTRLFELEIAGHGSSVGGDDDLYGGGGGGGVDRGEHHSLALSQSLSNDLLLVPFQQTLQQDNEHLRHEVVTARNSKLQSQSNSPHRGMTDARVLSGGGDGSGGDGSGANLPRVPDKDSLMGVAYSRGGSRDEPHSNDRFVDLSGITHQVKKDLDTDKGGTDIRFDKVPVPPVRSSSISLVDAYRPNSIGGSPRPRSPSEQETARSGRSSPPPRTVMSAHSSENSSRRHSRARVKSVNEEGGEEKHQQQEHDEEQHPHQDQHQHQHSRVQSKVNSRVSSRVSSPANNRAVSQVDLMGGSGVLSSGHDRSSSSLREKEAAVSRENLLEF